MEIKQLLESSNEYKVLKKEADTLETKWLKSGLLEGLKTKKEKGNMAMILENQAKRIIAEANTTGTGGTFTVGDGEQWAGVALPLVRKVFGEISAQDFVSVQPMNLPSGLVFFLDFKYGTSTNGRTDGDNMYGNVSTANDKMTVDEEVSGGLYGAGQFGYSINEYTSSTVAPVTGSASLADVEYDVSATGSYDTLAVATSSLTNFDPEGIRAFRLVSGSTEVDIYPKYTRISGANLIFVVDSDDVVSGSSCYVAYHKQPSDNSRGDFEADSSNAVDTSIVIPEIDVQLKSEAIVAKTRKLKAQWTPEFAQDLNAYQSVDAEAELTSMLSEYISMEIDLEILDMLITSAVTTEKWSAENNKQWNGSDWTTSTSDFYNTQGQWFQTLGTKIQKVSNKIHQKTLRGGANFIVVSPTIATIIESIPGYAAATDGDKQQFAMGVEKVGALSNRWNVYKNPYMTENSLLMGYRGTQFLEAGAVYSPYIPLMMTPLVYDPETFTPRKGLMTRYAKKMLRPEFYGRIYIADAALI